MDGTLLEDVYWLKDERISPDIVHNYSSNLEGVPIIIDNGSYTCRVGWVSDTKPRLSFRNCYAKQRKDRGKKPQGGGGGGESEILVANEISNIEAVRFQLKSQHDENVVTHFEAQEIMFDYTFSHLGINTSNVDHPVIITEPFCNPNYSRQCMSELLFECYGIPKVSYCVDGLSSYYYNSNERDGIIINIGNCTTHIMPVVDEFVVPSMSRRIKLGGQHMSRYLWRWLQLQFPQHLNAITLSRAEEIIYSQVRISEDYATEILKWNDFDYYEKQLRKIQLPFSAQPVSTVSAEQLKERKKEASKRLADINAKKREEKLEEDQNEIARLIELEEAMEEFTPDEAEYQHALDEAQVNSLQELQRKILIFKQRIDKTKMKIAQANAGLTKDEEPEEPKPKRVCIAAPAGKEERDKWLEGIKKQWREIQARKNARRSRRQEMAKRRTAASQERMRIISQLAKREKKEDNFGMKDEDWDVYKAINKDGGGSDSEEDEEKLQEVESVLKHHCPEFLGDLSTSKPVSYAENYQLLLGTEQIRIGELFFQPSMYGIEQGGIAATLECVLKQFSVDEQDRLVNNVFVTGGPAKLPGLIKRLEMELRAIRPFQSTFNITQAKDPELDAWFGAQNQASYLLDHGMTKQEYEELGGSYVKYHQLGNRYWAPVISLPIEDVSDTNKD